MRPTDQPLRLTLIAPGGRMGKAIAAAVAEDRGYALDADHGDVLVDFSAPEALAASLDRAVRAAVPILIGTTGLDDFASRRIAEASQTVAVLRASNTSLGVALLAWLQMRFFVLFFVIYVSVTLLINIGWQLGWRGLPPPEVYED